MIKNISSFENDRYYIIKLLLSDYLKGKPTGYHDLIDESAKNGKKSIYNIYDNLDSLRLYIYKNLMGGYLEGYDNLEYLVAGSSVIKLKIKKLIIDTIMTEEKIQVYTKTNDNVNNGRHNHFRNVAHCYTNDYERAKETIFYNMRDNILSAISNMMNYICKNYMPYDEFVKWKDAILAEQEAKERIRKQEEEKERIRKQEEEKERIRKQEEEKKRKEEEKKRKEKEEQKKIDDLEKNNKICNICYAEEGYTFCGCTTKYCRSCVKKIKNNQCCTCKMELAKIPLNSK